MTARLVPTRKMISVAIFCMCMATVQFSTAQEPAASPLLRRYTDGEKLSYHMQGSNDGWDYEVQANGVVKKDAKGRFVEEFGWSDFKSSAPMTMSPTSLNFRQTLSLDPSTPPSIPNLGAVQPFLIGPITDLLTFYADLWMGARQSGLARAGDHAYVRIGGANSWADGNYVILGEDSIDFDLTLKELNASQQTATLVVKHVPPAQPAVKLPAPWMQTPVGDAANNWIDVKKNAAGKYVVEVGQETFDVEIHLTLKDGKILAATLENLVQAHHRECSDAAYLECGPATNHQIRRHIELGLVP